MERRRARRSGRSGHRRGRVRAPARSPPARRLPCRARRPRARGRRSRAAARGACAPGRAGAPRPCAQRPRGRGLSPADPLAAASLGLPGASRFDRGALADFGDADLPESPALASRHRARCEWRSRRSARPRGRAGAPRAGRRSSRPARPRSRASARARPSRPRRDSGRSSENMLLNEAPPWPTWRRSITAKPPLSQSDDDQLVAGDDRAEQLGVEHQVRAVADEREHLAPRTRHARAPGAGELVAHAREAVLAVEGRRRRARAS